MYVSKSLHKLDDSRDRHKMRWQRHWSSDVCSSDLLREVAKVAVSSPEHVHTVADADGGDPGIVHLCADDPVGAEQPTEDVRMVARLRQEHHMRQPRSEEHTSELQSRGHLVCRLLLDKNNTQTADMTEG